jgi:hypothetical protein
MSHFFSIVGRRQQQEQQKIQTKHLDKLFSVIHTVKIVCLNKMKEKLFQIGRYYVHS